MLGRTVAEVADAWAPYLTMAEGIRIAAKAFTTDPSLPFMRSTTAATGRW